MKHKFEVKGNDILYYENMHLIETLVDSLSTNIKNLVSEQNMEDFETMLKDVEKLHAFVGNFVAYLRYRAFEFDVLPKTDTAEESAVQKAN